MPFFGPAPAHAVNTWAEYKRKQALHKLELILYMWHKRELTTLCDIECSTEQFILKGDILNSNFYWLKTRETTVSSMEDSLDLFLSYFPILFFAIGFIGNVLVIRIVHKRRQMHTPTNYLLANIAVSDVIAVVLISCEKFTENQLGRVLWVIKFATFACEAFSI